MAPDQEPTRPEPALSEDAAHRLLARAVELDAQHASRLSVAQLREIAREAGIAADAFDAALAEMRAPTPSAPARPVTGFVGRLWRRWQGEPEPIGADDQDQVRWTALATNAVAVAAFLALARVLVRLSAVVSLDWHVRAGALILANLLGLAIARRLRARFTSVVLAVTAAAQVAEYAVHVLFGIDTVQGGPTKWALLLAGLLGIGFGAVLLRTRKAAGGDMPNDPDRAAAGTPSASERPGPPRARPASLHVRLA